MEDQNTMDMEEGVNRNGGEIILLSRSVCLSLSGQGGRTAQSHAHLEQKQWSSRGDGVANKLHKPILFSAPALEPFHACARLPPPCRCHRCPCTRDELRACTHRGARARACTHVRGLDPHSNTTGSLSSQYIMPSRLAKCFTPRLTCPCIF